MTTPLQQTITIVRGDDYGGTVTFDQPVAGFASMHLTIRDDYATTQVDNTDATLSISLVATDTYTASIDITSAQTLTLQNDQYVYDVSVTTLAGKRYTAQRGTIRMIGDVDRS